MDIVLDSNIYRGDFLLRSNDFDVLLDYLSRTDSSILFPQIILDEIKEVHERTLKERVGTLNKAISNINLILVDEQKRLSSFATDNNTESEKYIEFLKKKLKVHPRQILQPKDSYLTEISKRAIKREKPCGEDGQGFRDALIWLTIKDYCIKSKEKQITIISNNDKDFSNSDKTDLHESLIKECDAVGIRINFSKSIRDFIEKHSVKIDFITEEWLSSKIDYESINEIISDQINGRKSRHMLDWINRKTETECTGYYKATHVNTYDLSNFSVYEMIDGTYIVNATFRSEVEIEYEYFSREYGFSRDIEYGYYHERRPEFGYKYIDMVVYASLTIKDEEIIETEIDDLDY